MTKNILVTTALVYANGSLHLGHLVENIRCDIWVKFNRMIGNKVLFIGGSDCHGTPIMINAEKQGLSPEEMVSQSHTEHKKDFDEFGIAFDNFYMTHSNENKELSAEVYNALNANGDIEKRTIEQAFDPEKEMFLPDRFIKGTCPKCGAENQYGDGCEVCGATYDTTELKNPKSVLSEATPITKESEHYFFKLENYENKLKAWIDDGHLQPQIANKLKEWFEAGLKSWDISRDAPYFGFEIPNAPGKYFYVWLDAPIGYLASLKNLANQDSTINYDEYWKADSDAEVYHFIGKDIVYFHALFWPAMLMGANLRTPNGIFVNGFLKLNGEKLSKSRGNFINARTYLDHLNPEYLRYYFAAKLNNQIEDIDLNLEDFAQKVNSDLVGKYVNLASRTAGFIFKKFDAKLSSALDKPELQQQFVDAADLIAKHYQSLDYAKAMRQIMELADLANQYVAEMEPWAMIKVEGNEAKVQAVCTQALNCFRLLSIYLKPVLPNTVAAVEAFLNIEPLSWDDHKNPLLNHSINKFKPLMQRIEQSSLNAIMESSK